MKTDIFKTYKTIDEAKKDYRILREQPIGTRIFIEESQFYYVMTSETKEPIMESGKTKLSMHTKHFEVETTTIRPN